MHEHIKTCANKGNKSMEMNGNTAKKHVVCALQIQAEYLNFRNHDVIVYLA